MKLLKIIEYEVKYKDNTIYCNRNIEVIDKNNILDLDKDIKDNSIKEEVNNIHDELINYIIDSNKISKNKINNKKFNIMISVSYTDINKCIDGYEEKYKECKTNKEFFDKYARTLKYKIGYFKDGIHIARYECYGALDTTMAFPEEFEHRYELSDYEFNSDFYSIGEIVKFITPNGRDTGVITGINGLDTIYNSGKLYEIISKDKKYNFWDEDNCVHHNDILKVIDYNIKLAYKYAKDSGIYLDSYINKLKKLI